MMCNEDNWHCCLVGTMDLLALALLLIASGSVRPDEPQMDQMFALGTAALASAILGVMLHPTLLMSNRYREFVQQNEHFWSMGTVPFMSAVATTVVCLTEQPSQHQNLFIREFVAGSIAVFSWSVCLSLGIWKGCCHWPPAAEADELYDSSMEECRYLE